MPKPQRKPNLCFSCLEGGHRSRECLLTAACGTDGCKKKRHKLLHLSKRVFGNQDNSEHTKLTSHTRQSSQVILQVVPVILHGPAKHLRTYAMLDLGSTCSLIENRIADELGLDGPQDRITLNGIQQRNSILSRKVSLSVSPSSNHAERWSVDHARTVEQLNLPNVKPVFH